MDKFWSKEKGIGDILHKYDSSTPKHNRSRKLIRRQCKRKLNNFLIKDREYD